MHVIKIDDGVWIDDKRIEFLKAVEINSNVDNISEVTITFAGKIDGLDNIQGNGYSFEKINKKI